MKKPFLLIVGKHYYPGTGTFDWKRCFATYEDALNSIIVEKYIHCVKRNDQPIEKERVLYTDHYELCGKECSKVRVGDWYTIVDLREWTE